MNAPTGASRGEVVVYEAPDGEVRVDVRLERETVWLTQEQMSQLFGRERSVITKHIRNVFREGELEAGAVCAKYAHTAEDGKTGAMVALTLIIAESEPGQKDLMIRLVLNLLGDETP